MDQKLLIYGNESWVVTVAMLKVLDIFYHRADGLIAVLTVWCAEDRELEYPMVVDALEAPGLWTINKYMHGRQSTIAEKVS